LGKENLTYRDEEVSFKEKKTLVFRFIGVLIFSVLIVSVAVYVLLLSKHISDFKVPLIIFGVFFLTILGFILFVHGRNAFQTKKRIYTGTITDKSEETVKFRNSMGQSTYTISLDGVEFATDLMFYNQVHKGQQVELHCLKGNSIFFVKELATTENVFSSLESASIETHYLNSDYAVILKKYLFRAIFFRSILLLIPLAFLYFIGILSIVVAVKDSQLTITLFRILLLVLGVIYVLFNRRVIFILMDITQNNQLEKSEQIIELQKSNLPKPSKNSVRTYQGYRYKNDTFYYIQTQNHWLQTNENIYNSLNAGDLIKVILAKKSKIVLSIEKAI
jgi:hypothetical protein